MSEPRDETSEVREEHVRAVRPGHGANCSSIGSVVDTLFVTALLPGGATLAAILAALRRERPVVVGPEASQKSAPGGEATPPEPGAEAPP